MHRRLLLTLLCVGLVAGGCSSDDDGTDDGTDDGAVATTAASRPRLPVAPSTVPLPPTAPTTAPPSTAGAVTASSVDAGPATAPAVVVTAGAYAECRARAGGSSTASPAALVALDPAGGAVRWSVCPGRAGEASAPVDLGPTVGGVFVADADGSRTFQAFTRDGKPAWSVPLPGTVVADHAAIVYAIAPDGTEPRTRALDAATGQERWNVSGETVQAARPDAVVTTVPGPPAQVVVRDPATNTILWAQAIAAPAKSVAFAGDRVVAIYDTTLPDVAAPVPGIAVFDATTGEPRWVQERPDAGAAIAVDDVVLVWNTDDSTSALDVADGTVLWRRVGRPLGGAGGVGVASDGLLFLGSAAGDPSVRVVDLATGTGRWSTASGDLRAQALGAGAGLLLFPTSLQGVEAVDMATGAGAWSFDWPPAARSHTNGVVVSPDLALVTIGVG